MKRWKYDEESLKKIYKESNIKMHYKDFKRWAEKFANDLLKDVRKEIDDEKTVRQ